MWPKLTISVPQQSDENRFYGRFSSSQFCHWQVRANRFTLQWADEECSHKQHRKCCPGSSSIQQRLGSCQVREGPVVKHKNDASISTTKLWLRFCCIALSNRPLPWRWTAAATQLIRAYYSTAVYREHKSEVLLLVKIITKDQSSSCPHRGRSVTVNRCLKVYRIKKKKVLFPQAFHSQTFLHTKGPWWLLPSFTSTVCFVPQPKPLE